MAPLDQAAVAAVDSSGQMAEVLDLPVHLRDALWRVDSAGLRPLDAPGGLVVAGMGGSGIGGRLALAALGPRARRPVTLVSGYELPAWAGDDAFLLASSYSGDTAETLAVYDEAAARGIPRVVATTGGGLAARAREDGVPVVPLPGGFQPRAAVGYATVVALEAAALCGAGPSLREEVESAAGLAERLAAAWGPGGDEDGEVKALARRLDGTLPVVAGAGLTAAVAYRWKCQLNENAKLPAFASELPELDHNEIVGWDAAPEAARMAAVFLEDPGEDERVDLRFEVTARVVAEGAAGVERVSTRGERRLERLVSLVLFGDLVSLYLAVLRGADPIEIRAIATLKSALATG